MFNCFTKKILSVKSICLVSDIRIPMVIRNSTFCEKKIAIVRKARNSEGVLFQEKHLEQLSVI